MSSARVFVLWIVLVAAVVGLSWLSVDVWNDKPEGTIDTSEMAETVVTMDMTVSEFLEANKLPDNAGRDIFGLKSKADLEKPLSEFNLTVDEIKENTAKAAAIGMEYESKNWIKIPVKFGLWAAYLIMVFVLVRKGAVNPRARRFLYLGAVALFGVILGADPSPMGTVKDAIALYAMEGVIFPPRMIALGVFLLMVILANKYICGWGCQLGTLQDLIFRLNRNKKDSKGIVRQYKIPFVISNSIRIAFLAVFTVVAVAWSMDMMESFDPFKMFKPQFLGIVGVVFIGVLLLSALFVYRPWCTLFCPFGLVGWMFEKLSLTRIKVDYSTCIACDACSRACPSNVMGAILYRDKKTIPDCFSCATCIDVCPTDSISFASGKRDLPPEGHFENKGKAEKS